MPLVRTNQATPSTTTVFSRFTLVVFFVVVALAWSESSAAGATAARDELFRDAKAHWRLGEKEPGTPLTVSRGIELGLPARGANANAGAMVARVLNSYFDAGKGINV